MPRKSGGFFRLSEGMPPVVRGLSPKVRRTCLWTGVVVDLPAERTVFSELKRICFIVIGGTLGREVSRNQFLMRHGAG